MILGASRKRIINPTYVSKGTQRAEFLDRGHTRGFLFLSGNGGEWREKEGLGMELRAARGQVGVVQEEAAQSSVGCSSLTWSLTIF